MEEARSIVLRYTGTQSAQRPTFITSIIEEAVRQVKASITGR